MPASLPASKKFIQEGATWTVRTDFAPLLPDNLFHILHNPDQHPELTLLRENQVRASFFLKLPAPHGQPVFVKRYKCTGWLEVLKYLLFPSKAASEWSGLGACEDRGLAVPQPLAFAEKRSSLLLQDSCIILEAIPSALPLNEYVETHLRSLAPEKFSCAKQSLALLLARLVKALHTKGVFYRDLHAGNILIRSADEGHYELFLIDLHRARFFRRVPQWMKIRDIAQLCTSLPLTRADRLRFLKEYCRDETFSAESFYALNIKLRNAAEKLEQRRIKSRSKRCIKNSTLFEVGSTWSEQYCGRRDFGKPAVLCAIEQHTAGDAGVLHQSERSVITIHQEGQGMPASVCVKSYCAPGITQYVKSSIRKSRAMKSWMAGNSLLVRGISTPLPLAVLERRRGPVVLESYLITEWLRAATELNDYITRLHQRSVSPSVKNSFITSLAETIRTLHNRGVYHADLKSTNILVREEGGERWSFYFVDLDRVTFKKGLAFRERTSNLAQINASVSSLITVKERLQFFHRYAQGTPLFSERKKYYRAVLKISRTKNTEPFGVSFSKSSERHY